MLLHLTRAIDARLVLRPGLVCHVPTTLEYTWRDPYAVWLTFPAELQENGRPIEWVFARELLVWGLTEPIGDGDVHIWPSGPSRVVIELDARHGGAPLDFPRGGLREFVRASQAIVPMGFEAALIDLDGELAALFGGE